MGNGMMAFPQRTEMDSGPQGRAEGWGDGPGVLGLTVRGVCETPAVRFLYLIYLGNQTRG
jgi:hypothetical protein